MPLSDTAIRATKPASKPFKVSDEKGLFLLVHPNGSRYWRMKYRYLGKEKTLALGLYPDVSLRVARDRRDAARKLLADGVDPGESRKAQKAATVARGANSLEVIAREWIKSREGTVTQRQIGKILAIFENDVFPWLGGRPIAEITAPEILSVMRRIDGRGARYTAHRAKQYISMAMRYAIATGRAERDPCPDLRGAIPPAKESNLPSITEPPQVGELLRAIDGFRGTFVVKSALLLAPLVFVRPGELRKALWEDMDLDKAEWRYHVTKTNIAHLVPLSQQAVAILRDLHQLTGHGKHVFPGRDPVKCMSDAAINAALRRMGYDTKTEITGHGFRAMARTILHEELGIKPEVIEHQLAHKVPDALGTAYNRTKFLQERRQMMQAWSDCLDKLKAGTDATPPQGSKEV